MHFVPTAKDEILWGITMDSTIIIDNCVSPDINPTAFIYFDAHPLIPPDNVVPNKDFAVAVGALDIDTMLTVAVDNVAQNCTLPEHRKEVNTGSAIVADGIILKSDPGNIVIAADRNAKIVIISDRSIFDGSLSSVLHIDAIVIILDGTGQDVESSSKSGRNPTIPVVANDSIPNHDLCRSYHGDAVHLIVTDCAVLDSGLGLTIN